MTQHGSAQPADTARALLEVVAGVLPGTPEPTYTRRWAITSTEWNEARTPEEKRQVLANRNDAAVGYASLLMAKPDEVNWVRLDWVWV